MKTPVGTIPGVLRSELLERIGVPHAFTTRVGGVSRGVYESLNFGSPGNLPDAERDSAANIRENWLQVGAAIGAEGREIVEVHQVHGAEVRVARAGARAHETADGRDTCADALVTDDPMRLVAVRVADCCPVLIASRDGRFVAAVHAGWRGVVGEIVPAAVRAMRESFGVEAGACAAAVGPCIGANAFEVGEDVAGKFRCVFGERTPLVKPIHRGERGGENAAVEKWLVDMKRAIREQLIGCGLEASEIDVLPHCTVLDMNQPTGQPLFFSHRREKGLTGRMVGIIGPGERNHH